ncbi:putative TetR-family transcriptional regulator [Microbacterium sp. C448]|uniref:TetR/AcrR family transcriptional regulator n=1 Tax=Microbacterium TaxID=33882 RepID=UPI0003DE2FD9|nr:MULTISPECIES: TetR/AcrR family transcriptional regulator [Microbacterium]CDK00212.1 putative TetR-family transcriptional regulator [Microbacterium sp. C448]
MPETDVVRPLRKDAARNRETVLSVAETIFARDGLGASIEAVAAAAGVGVGTVYRAFGSKAALVDALFAERVAESVAMIERCSSAPSGHEALTSVLRAFVELQSRSRAFQEFLFRDIEQDAARLRAEVEPLLTGIVERAKREGTVRADFAATDIPILTHTISRVATSTPGFGPELARRHLELLIKGLGPTPDETPVPPPLADSAFPDWMRGLPG